MKKLSLFMLMAVGLLISGNAFGAKGQGHPEPQQGDVAKVSVDVTGVITTTYYATLQDAFDDLPDNSYPATITMLADEQTTNACFKISNHNNVTLDLNGKMISASQTLAKGQCVIENKGTLTITDNSTGANGVITSTAEKPDAHEYTQYPTYASNTITNSGTIYMKAGRVVNAGQEPGAAQYAIDNSGALIMDGGTLQGRVPVRMVCNNGKTVTVKINGGEISAGGSLALWAQIYDGGVADVIVNDGTLKSNGNSIMLDDEGSKGTARAKVHINGGILYGDCLINATTEDCEITGGTTFMQGTLKCSEEYPHNQIMTGGIFIGVSKEETPIYEYVAWDNQNDAIGKTTADATQQKLIENIVEDGDKWIFKIEETQVFKEATFSKSDYPTVQDVVKLFTDGVLVVVDYRYYGGASYSLGKYWALVKPKGSTPSDYQNLKDDAFEYIANGYKAIPYTESNPETDLIIATLNEVNIDANGGVIDLSKQGKELDETTDLTITPISDANTTINIDEDTKVNKIEVTAPDGKGEAQIVVKDGVTLDVGNGGVVSENDILTTILVETGGTLIIGTGGIDKEGDATPIEIKASEEKGTGTLIFSPNAKHEDTKKYAEVDLYTYCKKVGEKYYWQQFAIPVTGLDNEKVAKNPNVTSYVFEWDYATYAWSQLSSWDQLDEPFAGYDMTNVSTTGGVVYTFKGNLIGNQNKQLTLPHKDYCVMGNSYTAPIDITALFDQINKEMSENTIEKTVYKYDAKAGYYVYTNELEQALAKAGVMPASFTDIKPMEGFLLNLQNGNTAGVMLNYANAVYTPATTPKPALAPRMNGNTDFVVAKINVSSVHTTDLVTLVEGDEFSADIENGKDAFKYLNEGANLYAFDGTNKLAMVATDNLEGTMLAFQAAEDAEYTLTFDRALNTEYVLVDMMNGNEVTMTEGNTYTFFATPNTLNPSRFMIVATAQAPTDMVNTKANKAAKGVYTITGQYLGNGEMWNELPQGIYMVNGVKVIK